MEVGRCKGLQPKTLTGARTEALSAAAGHRGTRREQPDMAAEVTLWQGC